MCALKPLKDAFSSHPRRWRDFRYVYPVISRRSQGLSIGINLNPDAACNFDCVYCCADRHADRPAGPVDLNVLEAELRHLVASRSQLFDEPEFRDVPPEYRRLNDIAFSGDGEPTLVHAFPPAVRLAINVRHEFGLDEAKIIIITNGSGLARPAVAEALAVLDRHLDEIWAKLDAGTEEYFHAVNRARCTLQHVVDSILSAARVRPIVLQSLFVRIHGEPPSPAEIAAYADRVRWLIDNGGAIALVQIYTVARRTAESFVTPLTAAELASIADHVRPVGVPVAVFA